MASRIALDRGLPVSIRAQLAGQIQYSIASGSLRPGEQLPSVRELAQAEGVAHVTASHVYRELKQAGLITVRPGMGTYVAGSANGSPLGKDLAALRLLVDRMVDQALRHAYTPAEISSMVTARLSSGPRRNPVVALIGIFGHATEVYAAELRASAADLAPQVDCFTIEALQAGGPEALDRLQATDLIVTVAHKVKEVLSLLPRRHPPVRGLTFTVHRETMARLQAVAPGAQLGIVSTFPEFLPTMLLGVSSLASPGVPPICAVLSDEGAIRAVLARAQVIVYASGSEAILSRAPGGTALIEYLHMPEQAALAALLPVLERLSLASGKGVPERAARGGANGGTK